mgnify:CR=1 FL=1
MVAEIDRSYLFLTNISFYLMKLDQKREENSMKKSKRE